MTASWDDQFADTLKRICALQPLYSSENSEPMRERGRLIRHDAPDLLKAILPELSRALGAFGDDVDVGASDGIGRKTEAPWVRVFSRSMSARPTRGFYVVLHFSADGSAMFVAINCGSTIWSNGDLQSVSDAELLTRTDWARGMISETFGDLDPFVDEIRLGAKAQLPRTFEKATVIARRLGVEDIRGDVVRDLIIAATMRLHSIYQAQAAGRDVAEQALNADQDARMITRLNAEELRRVGPIHIRHAVDRLLAGGDAPNFASSTNYDVVTLNGERLAPKKVFGLAIELALGIEAHPGHFSAGLGTPCFEIIQEAGFVIVEKSARTASPAIEQVAPAELDEVSWAEGNPRFAQHLRVERRRSQQAVAAKRAQVRADNAGRLVCENPDCVVDWYSVFPVALAEAVFEVHHTTPVAMMGEDHETRLDDLKCLCAACHRVEHRRLALDC